MKKGGRSHPLSLNIALRLQKLNVFCLEPLGSADDAERHRLAFLKAAEALRLDGRKMHKYVLTALTSDEAKSLGVVEPLYCSLFHGAKNLFDLSISEFV